MTLGLYCHVPFCASPCDFCGFYQKAPTKSDLARFLEGVELEIRAAPETWPIATLFWGGGTPGLLPARQLFHLGKLFKDNFEFAQLEWTVELSPSTVKMDKIGALLRLGVNRFSLGVQSFQEATLRQLGRRQNVNQIERAIRILRTAGCRNLNLDLIFATPGQTLSGWQRDLDRAVGLEPQHLSTYCLTFEDDTALFSRSLQGDVSPLSSDDQAGFYEFTWDYLKAHGYQQYEISNFARPGYECRHNLNTWSQQEWLGFGPSAASQFGGRRYTNIASLDTWLSELRRDASPKKDVQWLTPQILAADSLIFGLRLNSGVNLRLLRQRFPTVNLEPLQPLWRAWESAGLAFINSEGFLIPTRRGRLLADRLAVEILQHFDETAHDFPSNNVRQACPTEA